MNCYWIENTETTLAELREASAGVALLPLASIESHGPHLPLGSDPLCIRHVLKDAIRREPVAVLPVLEYSYVAEARQYPGAIHIRSRLLMDLVENICDEVYRNGFTKIVLLQGHGGNVLCDTGFLKRLLELEKPYIVYSVPIFAGNGDPIMAMVKSKEWGHACEFETSLNLAACPELVRLDLLGRKTFPSDERATRLGCVRTPFDWNGHHPEMAVGKPQLATVKQGRAAARYWAEGIAACVRKIKADTFTPAVSEAYRRGCARNVPSAPPAVRSGPPKRARSRPNAANA